jgi:uncharacterized protein
MTSASAIYTGWVMHRRLQPRRHGFRYRAWWLLLDIDELPSLTARLRWLSLDRVNLFAFYTRDFGHGAAPLRPQIERKLAEAGIPFDGGAIRLLCMPRVIGYAFNPLSIYFCYLHDGNIAALVYEVHNTFGERHSYVVEAAPSLDGVIRQTTAKRLHVSPFMGMDMRYDFRVSPPAETLTVAISGANASATLINASLHAHRRELSDWQLLRLLASEPLVTFKVIGAIHWEALRLLAKRLRFYPHPGAGHPSALRDPQERAEDIHA